jgi:nitric oxide reductase NorD protein
VAERIVDIDGATAAMLMSAVAGRSMKVRQVRRGDQPWIDAKEAAIDAAWERTRLRELLVVQGLLARIGAVEPEALRHLGGPQADRYVVLEVARGLRQNPWLAPHVTRTEGPDVPDTRSASDSVRVARSRTPLPAKPDSWGRVRYARHLQSGPPVLASVRQIHTALGIDLGTEEEMPERSESSIFLKLLSVPVGGQLLGRLLRASAAGGSSSGAGGHGAGASRRATQPNGGGQLVQLRLARLALVDGVGLGGSWYPEWDADSQAYRPEWCRVQTVAALRGGAIGDGFVTDSRLRRILAQFSQGMGFRRRAEAGDRLDLPAVVRSRTEARAGHPDDKVYIARERNRQDLGILVLLDCSGSAGEQLRASGTPVHEVQKRAAAQLVQAWSELGDRVACLGFHSRGRTTVHVYPVKGFDDPWGVGAVSALHALRTGAYTRLGAAIRHGISVLIEAAGTDRMLLVLVSDLQPFDEDYEGRYADMDVRRALDEAAAKEIAVMAVSTSHRSDPLRSAPLIQREAIASAGDESAFPDSVGRALSYALTHRRSASRPASATSLRRPVGSS